MRKTGHVVRIAANGAHCHTRSACVMPVKEKLAMMSAWQICKTERVCNSRNYRPANSSLYHIVTKNIFLKVGKCVYIGDFFRADKIHPVQPKKISWPPRPPLEVLQKMQFFTPSTFSSISRLSRHIMLLQLSNPSI